MTLIAFLCKCEVMLNYCEKRNRSCTMLHESGKMAKKVKKSALYDNEPMFRSRIESGHDRNAEAMGANVCLLRRAICLPR